MKKFTLVIFLNALLFSMAIAVDSQKVDVSEAKESAKEDTLEYAKQTIEEASQKTSSIMNDKKLNDQQRKQMFIELFAKDFNVNAIAKLALGKHWKSASEQEIKEYVDLFKQDIVNTYFNLLRKYYQENNVLTIVKAEKIAKHDGGTKVFSEAKNTDNQKMVSLKWNLLHGKILDVDVEGASLANAKKNDYQQLFRSSENTMAGFLKALSKKIKDASFKK